LRLSLRPVIVKEVGPNLLEGPVLVTIEYSVASGQEAEFIEAIRQYVRTRRRHYVLPRRALDPVTLTPDEQLQSWSCAIA
jgi:membrane-bound lytic murein transglycosylase MltF